MLRVSPDRPADADPASLTHGQSAPGTLTGGNNGTPGLEPSDTPGTRGPPRRAVSRAPRGRPPSEAAAQNGLRGGSHRARAARAGSGREGSECRDAFHGRNWQKQSRSAGDGVTLSRRVAVAVGEEQQPKVGRPPADDGQGSGTSSCPAGSVHVWHTEHGRQDWGPQRPQLGPTEDHVGLPRSCRRGRGVRSHEDAVQHPRQQETPETESLLAFW